MVHNRPLLNALHKEEKTERGKGTVGREEEEEKGARVGRGRRKRNRREGVEGEKGKREGGRNRFVPLKVWIKYTEISVCPDQDCSRE